jgi:hypothetical protein
MVYSFQSRWGFGQEADQKASERDRGVRPRRRSGQGRRSGHFGAKGLGLDIALNWPQFAESQAIANNLEQSLGTMESRCAS